MGITEELAKVKGNRTLSIEEHFNQGLPEGKADEKEAAP